MPSTLFALSTPNRPSFLSEGEHSRFSVLFMAHASAENRERIDVSRTKSLLMEHSSIGALRLAQLWELVAQKSNPYLLNYAQFAFLMKAALHSIPVESISSALRQELNASVDEKVMRQIVEDLMPFLGGSAGASMKCESSITTTTTKTDESISLSMLLQLEKRVGKFNSNRSSSSASCPNEPVSTRKAVILLYCAKMDIWLSPFMETEVMRAFCRLGKEWLKREIASLSGQNERLREEIRSKSQSFSSSSASLNQNSIASLERKRELEAIKKSISVKELTSRLHAASLRSSSSCHSPIPPTFDQEKAMETGKEGKTREGKETSIDQSFNIQSNCCNIQPNHCNNQSNNQSNCCYSLHVSSAAQREHYCPFYGLSSGNPSDSSSLSKITTTTQQLQTSFQDDSSTLCSSSLTPNVPASSKEESSCSELPLSTSSSYLPCSTTGPRSNGGNSIPISYVNALYAYQATENDELGFEKDSLIAVLRKGHDDWWLGECVGPAASATGTSPGTTTERGWFPSNYVLELEKCTVTQDYSNQLLKGRAVWAASHAAEWCFVWVPECEWLGIVPDSILDLPRADCAYDTVGAANGGEGRTLSDNGHQLLKETTNIHNHQVPNRNEKQHAAISELISSENRYIHNLSLMIQFYYKPIRSLTSGWSDSEVSLLFSNACDILEASISFGNELALCENGMMVAKLFCETSFDPYIRYCCNHGEALEYYGKRLKMDSSFAALIQETQKQPELKGMDLCGFLLEPMQRITRYPLLLKQLIKYTENKSELQNLALALSRTEATLSKINSLVLEREREAKLKDLNSRLVTHGAHALYQKYSLDLTRPCKGGMGKRILLIDGTPSRVKGVSGGGKRCQVYLFNDMLLICSRPKSTSSAIQALREPISTCQIRLVHNVPHTSPFVTDICYEATPETQEIISLYWTGKAEKNAWTSAIECALEAVKVAQISQIERSVAVIPKTAALSCTSSSNSQAMMITNCTIEILKGRIIVASQCSVTATGQRSNNEGGGGPKVSSWKHSLVIALQPGQSSPKRHTKPIAIGGDGKLMMLGGGTSTIGGGFSCKVKWNSFSPSFFANSHLKIQVFKWEPWTEDVLLEEEGKVEMTWDKEMQVQISIGGGLAVELCLLLTKGRL